MGIIGRYGDQVEEADTLYPGMPIGLVGDITEYMDDTIFDIQEGEVVVSYTDGITEAANLQNKFYGLERPKKFTVNNVSRAPAISGVRERRRTSLCGR